MAVVNLLLAFNVPQANVDNVQAILQKTQIIREIPAIGGVAPAVKDSVDLKSDGSDGLLDFKITKLNGCKNPNPGMTYRCETVPLQWEVNGNFSEGCQVTQKNGNSQVITIPVRIGNEFSVTVWGDKGPVSSVVTVSCRSDEGVLFKDSLEINIIDNR